MVHSDSTISMDVSDISTQSLPNTQQPRDDFQKNGHSHGANGHGTSFSRSHYPLLANEPVQKATDGGDKEKEKWQGLAYSSNAVKVYGPAPRPTQPLARNLDVTAIISGNANTLTAAEAQSAAPGFQDSAARCLIPGGQPAAKPPAANGPQDSTAQPLAIARPDSTLTPLTMAQPGSITRPLAMAGRPAAKPAVTKAPRSRKNNVAMQRQYLLPDQPNEEHDLVTQMAIAAGSLAPDGMPWSKSKHTRPAPSAATNQAMETEDDADDDNDDEDDVDDDEEEEEQPRRRRFGRQPTLTDRTDSPEEEAGLRQGKRIASGPLERRPAKAPRKPRIAKDRAPGTKSSQPAAATAPTVNIAHQHHNPAPLNPPASAFPDHAHSGGPAQQQTSTYDYRGGQPEPTAFVQPRVASSVRQNIFDNNRNGGQPQPTAFNQPRITGPVWQGVFDPNRDGGQNQPTAFTQLRVAAPVRQNGFSQNHDGGRNWQNSLNLADAGGPDQQTPNYPEIHPEVQQQVVQQRPHPQQEYAQHNFRQEQGALPPIRLRQYAPLQGNHPTTRRLGGNPSLRLQAPRLIPEHVAAEYQQHLTTLCMDSGPAAAYDDAFSRLQRLVEGNEFFYLAQGNAGELRDYIHDLLVECHKYQPPYLRNDPMTPSHNADVAEHQGYGRPPHARSGMLGEKSDFMAYHDAQLGHRPAMQPLSFGHSLSGRARAHPRRDSPRNYRRPFEEQVIYAGEEEDRAPVPWKD